MPLGKSTPSSQSPVIIRSSTYTSATSSFPSTTSTNKLESTDDFWTWSPNISNGYSVASARHLIDSHILDVSPNAIRWNRNIPIKVNVFLWRLSLNKLPSRENLDKKGIDVDSILCPICNDDVESVNHFFFTCDMAKDLWAMLARWRECSLKEWDGLSCGSFGSFAMSWSSLQLLKRHFYEALQAKCIITFKDDKEMEQGKTISKQLIQANKDSRFFIIFSQRNKGTDVMKDEVSQENVCEEEVPLNNNIGKQIGDFVDMPSEAVEQGMYANVLDEIDGAKGEQVPNHVIKKGNLEFLVSKEIANPMLMN
nr:reverse transcriptase domain, reverse transcriptase zinc-binding domain protein [Tanacetum cinerariifolium]